MSRFIRDETGEAEVAAKNRRVESIVAAAGRYSMVIFDTVIVVVEKKQTVLWVNLQVDFVLISLWDSAPAACETWRSKRRNLPQHIIDLPHRLITHRLGRIEDVA